MNEMSSFVTWGLLEDKWRILWSLICEKLKQDIQWIHFCVHRHFAKGYNWIPLISESLLNVSLTLNSAQQTLMLYSNFPVSKNHTNLPQQKKVLAVSNPLQLKIIKSSRALSLQSKIKKKRKKMSDF